MARCLVTLNGQTEDLKVLSALQSTDWHVVCQDGTYYLTSALLDLARDADDALQFAREIIPIINGAAQIYLANFEPVHLGGAAIILHDDGTKQVAQSIAGRARIRHSVPPADIKSAPPLDTWMATAYKDPYIEKALNLWGSLEHNWRNLYLVLEVMVDTASDLSAFLAQAWLPDKSGIELFRRTANNFRALGPDARHGTEQYKPPPKPMALPDARILIRRTLQAWLRQR
ncbi:MAG TPA: hypothetical protein VG456_27540 [Candidatus Sulfopaludibacter sp.]|jgi:hypothetical protein|nr:hypothetical protein [Candidatus Sulfopaludibacter sp.]